MASLSVPSSGTPSVTFLALSAHTFGTMGTFFGIAGRCEIRTICSSASADLEGMVLERKGTDEIDTG